IKIAMAAMPSRCRCSAISSAASKPTRSLRNNDFLFMFLPPSFCLETMLGIIIGNRGFFPAHLCESGRREILRVLEQENIKAVTLPIEATRFGAVESLADAQKCADLIQKHREEIDGVLVTLPNFGDERTVANT